jgi:hypothetical protein
MGMAKVLRFDRWVPLEEVKKKPGGQLNGRRILCVGNNESILNVRCAVLAAGGYHAKFCLASEARQWLQAGAIDLVILSTDVGEADTALIRSVVHTGAQMLALDDMIIMEELLGVVRLILR